MRVFLAGATGVIGRPLVPRLLRDGHHVTAMVRSAAGAAAVEAAGAAPAVADAFDAAAVARAMAAARPEVVIHQLTQLAGFGPHLDPGARTAALIANARIRVRATPRLVEAARAAGARRFVAQSVAFAYAPGPEPHREDDPLDFDAQGERFVTVLGTELLERAVTSAPELEGVVLRYGFFYGPGAGRDDPAGPVTVHVHAAAAAAALAVTRGAPGVYNVCDDGGSADNARAKALLGWSPADR